MASAPPPLELGAVIGGHRLDAVIGAGGMGVVYRATQLSLDRVVALKVVSPSLADDDQFRLRFVRETRLAASLEHPNVVPVYYAGDEDGFLFMTMRFIDGIDLRQTVAQEGRLVPERAAHIVAQIGAALDAGHAVGLTHRDVKPGNVLLDADDHAYLTDFGLATHGTDRDALTQTGAWVGTVDFVAPEQIQGQPVDARADQYALACVLFDALIGHPPFRGDSMIAVVWAHIAQDPPAPSDHDASLRPFDAVIARGMAKDPDDRFPSTGDFARAALAAAQGLPPPPSQRLVAPELGAASPPALAPPSQTSPEELWPAERIVPTTIFERPAPTSSGSAVPTGAPTAPPALPPQPPQPPPPQPKPPPAQVPAPPQTPPQPPPSPQPEPPPQPPPSPQPEPPKASSPAPDPFDALVPRRRRPVRIPLRDTFQYVHHPLSDVDGLIPLLGNDEVVNQLVDRIVHSSGGSFLVTGFRGVGKTTVIALALERLRAEANVLPVFLNVARPRRTEELLFEVIRRLFEALVDAEVLETLAPDVQRQLVLAYTRTSLSFKETRSNSTERARALGLSAAALPLLESLAPKLDFSHKTTDSLATEASFLAYSDADVEHDFLRIVGLFRACGRPRTIAPKPWERVLRRPPRSVDAPPPWDGKIVVVIDELDKLTAEEDGLLCVRDLLTGLKNLLTTQGVHFLFVGGPDLHDEALQQRHRGNSLYDSVFGWSLYVPCTWAATGELLRAVIDEDVPRSEQRDALRDYLAFKARGVPRLLLMELNALVQWEDARPAVVLTGTDAARVEFYAGLERVLTDFLTRGDSARLFSVPLDEDRWRMGAYYVTDWILRRTGTTFTVEDIVDAGSGDGMDPLLSLSASKVTLLLEHLVKHEVVERVRGGAADETFFGDVPAAQRAVYRVARDVGVKLTSFARVNESERAWLASAPQPWAESEVLGVVGSERYELLEQVDRGGMGLVYRAYDRLHRREVAIKLLEASTLADIPRMRARFLRKGELAIGIDHPNIVRTHETLEEPDGSLAIVMDFVDGASLRQLMSQAKFPAADAVRVGLGLLAAIEHLASRGLARLDLKPSSILVDREMHPVLVDLGLVKRVEAATTLPPEPGGTQVGVIVGTPAYAPPEQLAGRPVDSRGDAFSLALVLIEMITGRRARDADGNIALGRLDASHELAAVLAQALEPDPDARFPDPAAMRVALLATPEAARRPTDSARGAP